MAVNPDFRELFSALNAAEARYLVVGAYAVIHYTDPRYTEGIDIRPARFRAPGARAEAAPMTCNVLGA